MATTGLALAVLVLLGLSLLADSRPLMAGSRTLHSDALSSSVATGNSSITTTTLALNGGSAVAQQAANSGTHDKTVIAVGKDTIVLAKTSGGTTTPTAPAPRPDSSHETAAAPPCPFSPTDSNSVKDQSGRLWGWHNNASCIHKHPVNTHSAPTWETAPACPDSVPASSGVRDLSGRLWGWHNNASCTLKHAGQVASPANTTPVRAPGAPLVGHSRRLLAGANNAGLSVSAQTPLDPEVPADQLLHPTVTKTLVGTGNDTTACEYVSVPDAATGAQITQLKCDNDATVNAAITGTIASVDDAAASSNLTSSAPNAAVHASPPASTTSPVAVSVTPLVNPTPTTDVTVLPDASASVAVPTAPLPTSDAAATVVNRFGMRWEVAPVCTSKPTKRTAVQDTLGRLWWFESGLSCCYRDAQGASLTYPGYVQVKWDTAPACRGTPTLINSMADANGRLWGWEDVAGGQNCRFLDAGGKAAMHEALLRAVIQLASVTSAELTP